VIIAIAILTIVATAMMQSSIIVMQKNIENALRDEAVRIADMRLSEIRSCAFDSVDPVGHIDLNAETINMPDVIRTVRSFEVTFHTNKSVSISAASPDTKEVIVTVTWRYKAQDFAHSIRTYVGRTTG